MCLVRQHNPCVCIREMLEPALKSLMFTNLTFGTDPYPPKLNNELKFYENGKYVDGKYMVSLYAVCVSHPPRAEHTLPLVPAPSLWVVNRRLHTVALNWWTVTPPPKSPSLTCAGAARHAVGTVRGAQCRAAHHAAPVLLHGAGLREGARAGMAWSNHSLG